MRLINPSAVCISQDPTIIGAFKLVELAGRVCWKSENRITNDSWEKFIDMLLEKKHYSPLEFGTIYLTIDTGSPTFNSQYIKMMEISQFYSCNKYSRVKSETNSTHTGTIYYITTNLRVIFENNRIDDLQYFTESTDKHVQRVCFRIVTDRGVLGEITRHRVFSYCVESTRYCNYSLGRFNNELIFIIPPWTDLINSGDELSGKYPADRLFIESLEQAEYKYMRLLDEGWKSQQARQVLPNALKTEIMMCGFIDDYDHFFDLRMSEAAHPSMRQIASMMHSELYPTKNENE